MSFFTRLVRATNEDEIPFVKVLNEEGIDAFKTIGPAALNRDIGDVGIRVGDIILSVEQQVSPGGGSSKNFTWDADKLTKFKGRSSLDEHCYCLLGNRAEKAFGIVTLTWLKENITLISERKEGDKSDYYVIRLGDLASSGAVIAYGETLEECARSFAQFIKKQWM